MYRLQEFLVGRVVREIESLKDARSPEDQRIIRAMLTESFFWLHLGVEFGAFPLKDSVHAYRAFFVPFFESLLASGHERQEMLANRLYVAHSLESQLLASSFPRFGRVLIEKAMRGEADIFDSERNGFRDTAALRPTFQSLLILSSNLDRYSGVYEFTYYVSFASENVWRNIWSDEFTAEDVLVAQSSFTKAPAQICVGFIQLWSYATRVLEVFSDLEMRVSNGDEFKLIQRLRDMQSWRINLRSAATAQRFEQVHHKVTEGIESDARRDMFSRRTADIVQDSMNNAFESWFAAAPTVEGLEV